MKSFLLNTWDIFLRLGMAVGGMLAGMGQGWEWSMSLLLPVMAADLIAQIFAGFRNRDTGKSSEERPALHGLNSLIKKCMVLTCVLGAGLLDRALSGGTALFRSAVIWFLIGHELLSLLQSLALNGMRFPNWLAVSLEQWE